MKSSKNTFSKLINNPVSKLITKHRSRAVWLATFSLIGVATILLSQASAKTVSIEAELGLGAKIVSNNLASDGRFARFGAPTTTNVDAHLAQLLAATSRNTSSDKPAYINTPSAGLENDPSLYNSSFISTYNNSTQPGVTPGEGFGEFRAECDFSHYAYDDPVLYPGQPGKAHLHMIFGNTHTNAFSTYESLLNTGNSTCNGHEINRTAYWVPAIIDQDGNPRRPIKVLVYYKSYSISSTGTESWAPGNNGLAFVKPFAFPPGLQMINNYQSCTAPNLSWEYLFQGPGCPAANQITTLGANNEEIATTDTWTCGIVWNNGAHNGGDFEQRNMNSTQILGCPATGSLTDNPVRTLQQHVVFQYCSNNAQDMASRNYSSIKNDTAWNISKDWFFAVCPSTHKYKIPQIQYKISYPIYPGEDTTKWYLSSDINSTSGQINTTTYRRWNSTQNDQWTSKVTATAKNGATSHGDWFGAWNRPILDKWIRECSSIDGADCAEGVFPVPVTGATKALIKPTVKPLNPNSSQPFNGWFTLVNNNVFKVNGQQLHQQICGEPKLFTVSGTVPKGADIAYCKL